MKLYKLKEATLLILQDKNLLGPSLDWDELFSQEQLKDHLLQLSGSWESISAEKAQEKIASGLLAPMGNHEVWAAGVTYYRSRTARMEESEDSGGATFYDKVYHADRPELFFKATPSRVSHPENPVCIREDSTWDVPEPELTLVISPKGKIQGYTVGNDMSSRSIEGENPLYLPQAKVYQGCASVGPCILVQESLPESTQIQLEIVRNGDSLFKGNTDLTQLKRKPQELADWLFRANTFPIGCLMMTGTGVVPDELTLQEGDQVKITIDGIGTLANPVAKV
ncbi:fumarylacetoacetate hydrolase family protein [Algoriphagus namhaensis]